MTEDARAQRFAAWMAENLGVPNARIGLRLGGGNSNITHLVETETDKFVFRCAPSTANASAASGIRREFNVLRAVEGRLPAPKALALCEDETVAGATFVITAFVPGRVVSAALPPSYPPGPDVLRIIGEQMVDALACLHRVNWREAGLEAWDRNGSYVERQVTRWLDIRAREAVRPLPLLFELGQWLLANQPPSPPPTIVHGDFHLENALFGDDEPLLEAIIDWELATIGDPLADLGLFLMFWGPRRRDPPAFDWVQKSTRAAGVVSAEILAQRWAEATGLSVKRLDYYRCFAFWRLAAVVESAYVLQHQGKVDTEFARRLEWDVPGLLAEAADAIGR